MRRNFKTTLSIVALAGFMATTFPITSSAEIPGVPSRKSVNERRNPELKCTSEDLRRIKDFHGDAVRHRDAYQSINPRTGSLEERFRKQERQNELKAWFMSPEYLEMEVVYKKCNKDIPKYYDDPGRKIETEETEVPDGDAIDAKEAEEEAARERLSQPEESGGSESSAAGK